MVGDFARDILVLGMAGEEVAFTDVLALAAGKHAVGRSPQAQLEAALAAARELLMAGLARGGDLTADGTLVPATIDVLEQRARDLYDGYWGGQASFAMWLINTPEGEAIARSAPEDYDPLDEVEGRLPPAPRLPHTED